MWGCVASGVVHMAVQGLKLFARLALPTNQGGVLPEGKPAGAAGNLLHFTLKYLGVYPQFQLVNMSVPELIWSASGNLAGLLR